jgi:hypothetical protein
MTSTFDAHPAETDPLSDAGRERRDLMLDELVGRMHRRHAARRVRRSAAAGLVLAAAAGIAVIGPLRVAPEPARVATPDAGAPDIRVVRTDPAVLGRYEHRPATRIERLDDEGLLDTLLELKRPAGLIRRGGRVWLTANVTGPEPEASPAEGPDRSTDPAM